MTDFRCLPGWALLLSLLAGPLAAAEHFMLAAGGSAPQSSQVSIEKNAIWIDSLMRQRPFDSRQLLFTAGQKKTVDVVHYAPDNPEVQKWLPLARIYGQQDQGRSLFRHNQVSGITGAAAAIDLSRELKQTVASMAAGDSLFFVYNGHGGWEPSDTSKNTLLLWNETQLDAREFADILQDKAAGASVRYVFPQCYAGGFARSIADDAVQPTAVGIRPGQCGFFAVPGRSKAEGCTRGVDVGDYRDYSTFFFAALTGQTRQGAPLQPNPAAGHQPVSLSQAHAWAYTYGLSADVPFATSEYFLELWQPWYSRWQSAVQPGDDNPYSEIAGNLAENIGVSQGSSVSLPSVALARRKQLEHVIQRMASDLEQLKSREQQIRAKVLARFHRQWPAAAQPYSAAYIELLTDKAEPMLEWIVQQPDYHQLERLQSMIEQKRLGRLESKRAAAGFERLHRMLKLAAIYENFKRFANDEAHATYQSLRHCESWALPSGGAKSHE